MESSSLRTLLFYHFLPIYVLKKRLIKALFKSLGNKLSQNKPTRTDSSYNLDFGYLLPPKFLTFADCNCPEIYESSYF